MNHISVMEHYVLWFFGLFFFSLKICTSQVMGIGLCSPQLAAPSGWQLTGLVLVCLQSPVCSYCSAKSTLMSFCGGKGNSGCPGVVGSASSTWHSVSLCPCCLSPRAGRGVLSHSHSLISLCCCRELHPVLGQSSASCWHEGCHCFSGDGWAVHCLSLCLI